MLETPLRFAPPPRPVPFSISLLASLNAAAQIGWFITGFTSIFFWTFAGNADVSFLTFHGTMASSGVVTGVESTQARENRQTVRANHYDYSVAGRTFSGTSYSTGETVAKGDRVAIEYTPGSPQRSRIVGQRRSIFSAAALFVLIFPAIGLGIVIAATRWGNRRGRLLRDGVFTTGVLKSKRATNTTVNKRRVYELSFEFTARDGRKFEAKARTSDTARLEDEREEPLLYDPEKPEDAVMLDEAPTRPQFDDTGALMARPTAAFLAMIIPAIVIAANTLVLLLKVG